jgi:hypothetical protein
MLGIYSGVLLVALFNIVVYLVIGRRYKMYLLCMFYICALFVLIPRILSLSYLLKYFNNGFGSFEKEMFWGACIVATYFKAIMGVFQIVSMLELKWRL